MILSPISFSIKREIISFKGKKYHPGTKFWRKPNSKIEHKFYGHGHWYEFETPKNIKLPYAAVFEIMFIPDWVFRKLSKDEKRIKDLREAERLDHMEAIRASL